MFTARSRPILRPALAAALAAAVAFGAAASAFAAGVADYVPSDALVVIKVNKVQSVSDKAGKLMKDLGIAEMNPDAADPLGAFQKQNGLSKGLNASGDMIVYVANAHLDEDEPALVAIVPVSDYAAFKSNFKDVEDMDSGVSKGVATGEDADDKPVYFMKAGDYAVVSNMQDVVKAPDKAIQFEGVTGKRLGEKDAVVYANFKQLGPMLTKQMQEKDLKAEAKKDAMDNVQQNPQLEKFGPVVDAAIDQLFMAGESFLRDADAAAVTLNLSGPGVNFGVVAQFKPDSYLAKLFGNVKTSDDSLLGGLPQGTYIVYGGTTADKAFGEKLFGDLLGPVIAKLKTVPDTEGVSEYIDTVKSYMTSSGDARYGLFAPTGGFGQSPLLQQVVVQDGDAKQLKADQKKMAELGPQIMKSLGIMPEDGADSPMQLNTTYTADVKTVAGVSFDKVTQQVGVDAQNAGPNPMTFIYGPEGPVSYLGTVNNKLLTVVGLNDQQIEGVVAAVKDGGDPLAKVRGVKMVAEQLPGSRSGVFYFQPDELLRSGLNVGRQMGFNVPVQLPDDLPPVGVVVGPAENSLAIDGFISRDLMQAMVVAGLQIQQQVQGGGPGGGL